MQGRVLAAVGVLSLSALQLPALAPSGFGTVDVATGDTLRVWQSFSSLTGFGYQYREQKGDVGLGGFKIKAIVKNDPSALREARTFGRFEVPTFFTSLASGAVLGAGV